LLAFEGFSYIIFRFHVNIGGPYDMITLCPDNSPKGETIMAKHLTYDDRSTIEGS